MRVCEMGGCSNWNATNEVYACGIVWLCDGCLALVESLKPLYRSKSVEAGQ